MLGAMYPPRSRGANQVVLARQVRTWVGDVCDLPAYQGPFNAAFFNSVFANVADQGAALLAAALQLRPGGHLVISHPLGRAWIQVLCQDVPHQFHPTWGTMRESQTLIDCAHCSVPLFQQLM